MANKRATSKHAKADKKAARDSRRPRRNSVEPNVVDMDTRQPYEGGHRPIRTFRMKGEAQGHARIMMEEKQLTFLIGSAGHGKTYMGVHLAAELLRDRRYGRIVLVRPIVESKGAGQGMGYLPGEKEDKCAPYMSVYEEMLLEHFGPSELELLQKRKTIEFVPLEFMRGKTFDNAVVIMDEAQNATPEQMKLFLTRIGEYSKFVVCGDTKQSDIRKGQSGLAQAVRLFGETAGCGVYTFTPEDIVRSGLARLIVEGYEADEAQ